MITLSDVADGERIARIVDHRRTPAWRRASLRNPPLEGPDTYEWMTRTSPAARAEQVRAALLEECPWASLVQTEIRKPAPWAEISRAARAGKRLANQERRPVVQDTRVDHARQLALKEAVEPIVETKLTKVAVAYRPGLSQAKAFLAMLSEVRGRGLGYAYALDLRHCFDEVPWDLLDRALDRHLGSHVEGSVLRLLKSLYRVDVVNRAGRKVLRDRGIPQGLVLAPLLLNLFLRDVDLIVQRAVANLGCIVRRHSDDILIVGPDPEALQKALRVVERELARVRLRVKPSTRVLRDLRNRENAPTWLGFAFTMTRTWIPRARIERKAAELLEDVLQERLDRGGLDTALEGLHAHCLQVLHPGDADRAVAAIETLLSPHVHTIPRQRKEGIDSIRQQLRRRLPLGRTTPAPQRESHTERQVTFPNRALEAGNVRGKGQIGQDDKNPFPSSMGMDRGGPATETPPGGSAHDPRTSPSLPSRSQGARGEEGDLTGGRRACVLSVEQGRSFISGSSLASTGRPTLPRSPAPDQARHRDGPPGKPALTREGHLGLAVVVRVEPLGPRRGRIRLDYSDGDARAQHFRAARAASVAEILLAGYWAALSLIRPVGRVVLAVGDPTLAGYIAGRFVVRSPDILWRWELLLARTDRLESAHVFSETGGHRVAWNRGPVARPRWSEAHALR
jgi:hypothetical protein